MHAAAVWWNLNTELNAIKNEVRDAERVEWRETISALVKGSLLSLFALLAP
jgi:hypothetical protein